MNFGANPAKGLPPPLNDVRCGPQASAKRAVLTSFHAWDKWGTRNTWKVKACCYYRLVWGKAPKPETKGPKLKDAFSFGRKDTLLTKHFTFLVGISGYLSLVKTEEHGTMAELSGKRESAIMTHHFLRKVSTCGSMEGRGTGTGVHLGMRAVPRGRGGGGLTGAHSRPRSSFRLPECPSCPGPG